MAQIKYTTSEINTALGNLNVCINMSFDKYYSGIAYGHYSCNYGTLYKKMIRCMYLLQNWHQNTDGSTTGHTNVLTQPQMSSAMSWVKKYCNC